MGLVRQTSPSPRAVRGVALTTHPPILLSMMTLLLPLPAGQTFPKAKHSIAQQCAHTNTQTVHLIPAGIYHVMIQIHELVFYGFLRSLHQPFAVEDSQCWLILSLLHLHDVKLFILPPCLICALLSRSSFSLCLFYLLFFFFLPHRLLRNITFCSCGCVCFCSV